MNLVSSFQLRIFHASMKRGNWVPRNSSGVLGGSQKGGRALGWADLEQHCDFTGISSLLMQGRHRDALRDALLLCPLPSSGSLETVPG